MTLLLHIAVLSLCLGAASDNLLLSSMSGNTAQLVKSNKWFFLLLLLLIVQLQVLMLGDWVAQLITKNQQEVRKWISLGMMFSMAIKMTQELKIKNVMQQKIPFGLNSFLNITLASSIYIFVLGFVLHCLKIDDKTVCATAIPSLFLMMIIGWLAGHFNLHKTIAVVRVLAIFMILTGVIIFLISK